MTTHVYASNTIIDFGKWKFYVESVEPFTSTHKYLGVSYFNVDYVDKQTMEGVYTTDFEMIVAIETNADHCVTRGCLDFHNFCDTSDIFVTPRIFQNEWVVFSKSGLRWSMPVFIYHKYGRVSLTSAVYSENSIMVQYTDTMNNMLLIVRYTIDGTLIDTYFYNCKNMISTNFFKNAIDATQLVDI